MKVALFTETYEPYINGVVTHVKALKNGLEKLGHEVLVVCANPNIKHYYIQDNILNCPGVSFKKIYNYGIATPISQIRYKYIKEFNPDIIHIHTEFGVGYSGSMAAKLLKVPLIYTMHTMYDDYLYYVAPPRFINVAKKMSHAYAKLLAKKATCLTGPSKKVEEFFRSCGVTKPVYVIPNPVETELFNPNNISNVKSNKIREKYNILKDDLLLCFCGRLGKEKNVDTLIKYWYKEVINNKKYKLLIIGDGPAKEELQNLVNNLNLNKNIFFAGKIAHENLPPYYKSADLYITTSLSDTNSISMLEAMSTGLPVIHIKDEKNRGQVVDGKNGFIFNSVEQLMEILDNYYNLDITKKTDLKKSARKSVESKDCVTLAKNLLNVYNIAISNN